MPGGVGPTQQAGRASQRRIIAPGGGNDPADRGFVVKMKVPHSCDELQRVLGDVDKPFFGLFTRMPGYDSKRPAGSTASTAPTAADRERVVVPGPAPDAPRARETCIHYGLDWELRAPNPYTYPANYAGGVYVAVCPFCLECRASDAALAQHMRKCAPRHPPGREIYRCGARSVFEVDGTEQPLFCQNLCVLGKAFLATKGLHVDVQPFLFYVLTENTPQGCYIVGYFSKQRIYASARPAEPVLCLSCIVVLPCFGGRGYGQLLIDVSYALVRRQHAVARPETPLSVSGERAFRRFWQRAVRREVLRAVTAREVFTLDSLSARTGIVLDHVLIALEDLRWLQPDADAVVPCVQFELQEEQERLTASEHSLEFMDPSQLVWAPTEDPVSGGSAADTLVPALVEGSS